MNRIWWNPKWKIPINSLEFRSVEVPSYSVHTVVGWIFKNFEFLIFKPKLYFWRKITKMITRVNSWISNNSPSMILKICNENRNYWYGHFSKSRNNHIQGELEKIREFILIIFMIFNKMTFSKIQLKFFQMPFKNFG